MTRLIATFLYSGLLRPAPGTWGSLVALPAFWALHVLGGPILCALAIPALFALGWWAAAAETARTQDHDPGWIVIDEVVGQWIALMPLSFGAWFAGADILALWPGWVSGFLLFRLFDIWKPGPVGTFDRRGDVAGLMLDDVAAGAMAALSVMALAVLAHAVILL